MAQATKSNAPLYVMAKDGSRRQLTGATGFEPATSTQSSLRNEPFEAEEAQIPAQLMNDPQFRDVMQAWQDLPLAIRTGILALIAVTQLPRTRLPTSVK
jgi:hypothetical protein